MYYTLRATTERRPGELAIRTRMDIAGRFSVEHRYLAEQLARDLQKHEGRVDGTLPRVEYLAVDADMARCLAPDLHV